MGSWPNHAMFRSRTYSFDDPLQYGPAIRAAEIEMHPTHAGTYRSSLVQCNLDSVWMQHMTEHNARVCHGAVIPTRTIIEFLTDGDQPAIRHSGLEVTPGMVVVNDPSHTHRRSFGPCRFGTMSLANGQLARLALSILGRELGGPTPARAFRPSAENMAGLLRLHAAATDLALTAPETLAHPEVARGLEQGLARAMVHCLADEDGEGQQTADLRHSAVVSRLDEVLSENPERPLYLAEICASTGISERTMRAWCHDHLGMGPLRYLWLRRMHLARAALLRETPPMASVTQVACAHGFWELGRFAVQYRALFGERPSETLHRPPVDQRVPARIGA